MPKPDRYKLLLSEAQLRMAVRLFDAFHELPERRQLEVLGDRRTLRAARTFCGKLHAMMEGVERGERPPDLTL